MKLPQPLQGTLVGYPIHAYAGHMVQLRTYWVGKALGTLAVLVWFAGDIPDPIAIIVLLISPGITLGATNLLVGLIFGARWREGLVRNAEALPDAPAHWPAPLRIPKSIDTRMIQSTLVAPEAFICPLSLDIMRQPAVTPRGTTYDREALSRWVTAERRYPAGEAASPLRMDQLAPNLIVRNLIQAWLDEQEKGGGKANKGGGTQGKRRKAGS